MSQQPQVQNFLHAQVSMALEKREGLNGTKVINVQNINFENISGVSGSVHCVDLCAEGENAKSFGFCTDGSWIFWTLAYDKIDIDTRYSITKTMCILEK